MKKTVVLGITSGIAAYKSVELIQLLKKENIDVSVIMTDAAVKMVDPKEFEDASGNKVYTELFEKDFDYKDILKLRKVDHIDLADKADVIVIAPATANTIAKLANGFADDFLTTTVLAANSPVVVCPSMNVHMWKNPLTQDNIKKLQKLGYIIIPPESGMLACGYEGPGRLPHLETIKDEVLRQIVYSKSLAGKKIVVTAGGTTESIDDARVITNKSTGKMGIAIAEELYLRGADVLLLRAKQSVSPRYHIKEKLFENSKDLSDLLESNVPDFDIVFHIAAVSDFLPEKHDGKIPSSDGFSLHFNKAAKIISQIKKWNSKIKLIGFKAVSSSDENELIKKGREKLKENDADAIIVNDISQQDRGFGAGTNEVYIVTKEKVTKVPLDTKKRVAQKIMKNLF